MPDTDNLPREEIEARMTAGLKRALATPPKKVQRQADKEVRSSGFGSLS